MEEGVIKAWETYEEVAAYLLDQMAEKFGLIRVEGKQTVSGIRSGTSYEIDAKGVAEHGEGIVIIECRRYTGSKQNQEQIGALAYRILDTGADGGILVGPLGLQEGAAKIADAENIGSVVLAPESTTTRYVMQFLNSMFAGVSEGIVLGESVSAKVTHADGTREVS